MSNKSITKNYIYNIIYQVLIIALPVITTPYISRVLGPKNLGIHSFTVSIVTYFILFGSLGISLYGQREIAYNAHNKRRFSKVFWEIFLLRLITMVISLFVFYIFFVFKQSDYKIFYIILSLDFFSNILDISWFFQGLEEFKTTVIVNVIIKILSVISIFLFVKTDQDLVKYFLIYSSSAILGNISLWFYLFKIIVKVNILDLNILKHLKPTILLFIPQIAIKVYTVLDRTMIGLLTDMTQVGLYEQAYKIISILLALVTSLGIVMIPRIANLYAKKNSKEIILRLRKSFHIVWFLGLPIMFGLLGIASNFVPWFFGSEFINIIPIFRIGSLLIIAIGLNNITGMQYLIPIGKQNYFTISVIIGAIINFIGNYFCIRLYGAVGAIIFSVIAEFSIFLVQLFIVKKDIVIKDVVKEMPHCLISSLIMFLPVFILSFKLNSSLYSTFIIVCLGVLVYGISMIAFKDKLMCEIINKIKMLRR